VLDLRLTAGLAAEIKLAIFEEWHKKSDHGEFPNEASCRIDLHR
jgi:hypothetical protein